jgi:7,8-dihydropterin-6-yl-methyl-4-(beta-D-ribofuranosyl)aminobenzene 5'-phosphate synthase
MIDQLEITVLADNTVARPDLLGEHGLAYWIRADKHRILFDTGQGRVLLENAERLGIDLESADCVVVSHGHFDHTGGLADRLRSEAPLAAALYAHPEAFAPKYARLGRGGPRAVGIPDLDEAGVRARVRARVPVKGPTPLAPGILLTGEIPRTHDFEDTGGAFFLDAEGQDPDPLRDDLALCVEVSAGLVVILGCAHAGVVNTLDYVAALRPDLRIHAVLGGMHLLRASEPRLEATVEALLRHDVDRVGAGHCTGTPAIARLWERLPGRCVPFGAGARFSFPAPSANTGG